MSGYDAAFHVMEDSRWLRFKRDIRLILWISKFTLLYLTIGWVVRRIYQMKKRRGQPYYIN